MQNFFFGIVFALVSVAIASNDLPIIIHTGAAPPVVPAIYPPPLPVGPRVPTVPPPQVVPLAPTVPLSPGTPLAPNVPHLPAMPISPIAPPPPPIRNLQPIGPRPGVGVAPPGAFTMNRPPPQPFYQSSYPRPTNPPALSQSQFMAELERILLNSITAPPPPPPPPAQPPQFFMFPAPQAYFGNFLTLKDCECKRGQDACQAGKYQNGDCEDGVICCENW